MNTNRNRVCVVVNVITSCKDQKERMISERRVEENVTSAKKQVFSRIVNIVRATTPQQPR